MRNVYSYAILTVNNVMTFNSRQGMVIVMPIIRPITDLRNTTEISELCNSRKEPIFITKNGYGDLVIMSMETYDSMFETAADDAAANAHGNT